MLILNVGKEESVGVQVYIFKKKNIPLKPFFFAILTNFYYM